MEQPNLKNKKVSAKFLIPKGHYKLFFEAGSKDFGWANFITEGTTINSHAHTASITKKSLKTEMTVPLN